MDNTSLEKTKRNNKTKKWIWFVVIEVILGMILVGIDGFYRYCGPQDNPIACVIGSILGVIICYVGFPYLIALIFARNKYFHTVAFALSLFLLISQFYFKLVAPVIFR